MSNIEVIGLGALNIDNLYRVERIIDDGEAMLEDAKSFPGGSAANTIYGLARLGVKTGFAGVVGDDTEGRILLDDFGKIGVDTSQIRVKPGARSGSVLCLSDTLGRRSLYVLPGANSLMTEDDLDLGYLNRAGMLHLSSFADNGQFKVLLKLVDSLDRSVKLSFAPGALYASRGLKVLAPILRRTDILFLNRDEVKRLTGKDIRVGAEICLGEGCKIAVVTLGRGMELKSENKGSHGMATAVGYIRDSHGEYLVEPPGREEASDVETTGAGDAFSTGFLYGLLKGKTLEECGQAGHIAARFSMAELGARAGLPTPEQLSRRHRELYSKKL